MKRAYLAVAGLWTLCFLISGKQNSFAQTIPACAAPWTAGIAVTVGEIISFNGQNFRAIQAEISAAPNWQPPNVPALWALVSACQTGTTQPPPPPPSTPPPNGADSLPKHLLLGYWQDFVNGATPLTIAQVPTNFNIIAVAFGNATGTPGQVSFSIDSGLSSALGGYTAAQFIADINTAHSRGQRIVLSVGGQNGSISVADAASAANFANSVSGLMNQYGFDGVDIDLENGINPTQLAAAIMQLKGRQPNALVTAAPQTVDVQNSQNDYFQFATAIGSNLTMMNTQYYNSGTMLGCDGNVYAESTENFITALACTQLQGLAPNTIGIGLPASTSAAGSGFVDPSVVVSAIQCLSSGTNCGSFHPPSTWPTIRGVMTFSINWDASNGYSFSNTVAPALQALP